MRLLISRVVFAKTTVLWKLHGQYQTDQIFRVDSWQVKRVPKVDGRNNVRSGSEELAETPKNTY